MNKPAPIYWLPLVCLCLLLSGCAGRQTAVTPPSPTTPLAPRPLVTLQPTFTAQPTAGPLPSITPPPPRPTAVANTPIPFDEAVVELRYQIPALGLDRRLQGNVAANIIVVDEATGLSRQRSNQAGIMLELRAALPLMDLDPVPDGCAACVQITYDMPAQAISGSGWLQDPVLLASIENYLAVGLGPHFPPGTQIGLRRSASPYAPAHTLTIVEDGRSQIWLATEAQIEPPAAANPARAELALLAELPLAGLRSQYIADCPGRPIETLFLQSGSQSWSGTVRCPELSLPNTLLPLYLRLDEALAGKTAVADLDEPEPLFPLAALVVYRRADGSGLTLFQDGALEAIDATGQTISGTLAASATLSATTPISLTQSIIRSNLIQPGFRTFGLGETAVVPTTPQITLAARGPDGVLDGRWDSPPNHAIFATLEELLTTLLNANIEEPALGDAEPTSNPEPTPTP
jgi:hypothetical protein